MSWPDYYRFRYRHTKGVPDPPPIPWLRGTITSLGIPLVLATAFEGLHAVPLLLVLLLFFLGCIAHEFPVLGAVSIIGLSGLAFLLSLLGTLHRVLEPHADATYWIPAWVPAIVAVYSAVVLHSSVSGLSVFRNRRSATK